MARSCFLKVITYLFLFNVCICINWVSGTLYSEYTLTEEFCSNALSSSEKQKLYELNDDNAAMIMKYNRNKKDKANEHITCDFVVDTHNIYNGVFVVIQNISVIREGSYWMMESPNCDDYIQFTNSEVKFCHTFERKIDSTDHVIWNNDGRIETVLHKLKNADVSFIYNFKIVYTMYKDCETVDPNVYQKVMRDKNVCIMNKYFCDGIYNCGGIDDCLDEKNCPRKPFVQPTKNDSHIEYCSTHTTTGINLNGFVVLVCTVIIILIFSLWMYNSKMFFWPLKCKGPTLNGSNPEQPA